jgi:hypothetical protein
MPVGPAVYAQETVEDLKINYIANSAQGVSLYTIPEPSSPALISLAAMGMLAARRRKKVNG